MGLFRHGPRTTLYSNQHSLATLHSKLSKKQGRGESASSADRFAPLSLTALAAEISSVLSASKRVAGEVDFGSRLRGSCVFRAERRYHKKTQVLDYSSTLLCLAGIRTKPNGTTIVARQDWVIARDSPSLTSSPRGRTQDRQ